MTTVIYRFTSTDYLYNFSPLWSYFADSEQKLLRENFMNVVMGIPIGFLLCLIMKQRKWIKAFVFGFSFSALIEILQLVLKRGFCELDDVIHNTLGCILGYLLGIFFLFFFKKKIAKL